MFEHSLWTLLGTHLKLNFDLFLSLSIVHDEGLLANRCLFITVESLTVYILMLSFGPGLRVLAKVRVEILHSRDLLLPRCVLIRVYDETGLPLEFFR